MMHIIEKATEKSIATIMANHSMTIEEACNLCGVEYMVTEEDFQDGEKYDITALDLIHSESYYFPHDSQVDSTFGSEMPVCVDFDEAERLCYEWDIDFDELWREATDNEVSEYGVYNSSCGNR